MEIIFSENELEDFLCKDNNLRHYLGIELVARQINIGVGIIDILGYHRTSKTFIIIELKKKNLDLYGYEQCIRYKRKLNNSYQKKHKFSCLLIGTNLHEELNYIVKKYNVSRTIFDNEYVYYALFNISFEDHLSFDWFSKKQQEIQNKHFYMERL